MSNSQPYVDAPAPTPASGPIKKQRNTVGLIGLIAAVIGFIFACIPGALIVGWLLLPVGFILGIVGLFMKGKAKWQSITAIVVSVLGTIVGVIVFTSVLVASVDDALGGTDSKVGDSAAVEEEPVAEEDAAEEPADEVGTRQNPAPLGTPIEGDEWTVVVNSVDLDATEEVAAANDFNEAADEGTVYITINLTTTYTGTDPEGAMPAFVGVEYVTADGVTVNSLDKLVVGPDELDTISALYEGASATGNHTIQVPAPVDGVIAINPGMIADTVFVSTK